MSDAPVSPQQYGYPWQCLICGDKAGRFTRIEQLENHIRTVHQTAA